MAASKQQQVFWRQRTRPGHGLGLAHDAEVVFNGQDLAGSGAKNGLRIGRITRMNWPLPVILVPLSDDSRGNRELSPSSSPFSAVKRYSSMTTPTPRRPLSSKLRTTRPRQSSRTSAWAPITSAGREMVKSTGISESTIWNRTHGGTVLGFSMTLAPSRRPLDRKAGCALHVPNSACGWPWAQRFPARRLESSAPHPVPSEKYPNSPSARIGQCWTLRAKLQARTGGKVTEVTELFKLLWVMNLRVIGRRVSVRYRTFSTAAVTAR